MPSSFKMKLVKGYQDTHAQSGVCQSLNLPTKEGCYAAFRGEVRNTTILKLYIRHKITYAVPFTYVVMNM
jgi:hypothetical protein